MPKITGPGVPSHSGRPAQTDQEVSLSVGTSSSASEPSNEPTPSKPVKTNATRKRARTTESR